MKITNACLLTGLTLGFPLLAVAQQGPSDAAAADVRYCGALAKSYQSAFPAQEGMPVSDVVVLNQCDSNPRATIPVLEKKLADKKITLPADDRIAHQSGAPATQR